jgi:hypothetical protein
MTLNSISDLVEDPKCLPYLLLHVAIMNFPLIKETASIYLKCHFSEMLGAFIRSTIMYWNTIYV